MTALAVPTRTKPEKRRPRHAKPPSYLRAVKAVPVRIPKPVNASLDAAGRHPWSTAGLVLVAGGGVVTAWWSATVLLATVAVVAFYAAATFHVVRVRALKLKITLLERRLEVKDGRIAHLERGDASASTQKLIVIGDEGGDR